MGWIPRSLLSSSLLLKLYSISSSLNKRSRSPSVDASRRKSTEQLLLHCIIYNPQDPVPTELFRFTHQLSRERGGTSTAAELYFCRIGRFLGYLVVQTRMSKNKDAEFCDENGFDSMAWHGQSMFKIAFQNVIRHIHSEEAVVVHTTLHSSIFTFVSWLVWVTLVRVCMSNFVARYCFLVERERAFQGFLEKKWCIDMCFSRRWIIWDCQKRSLQREKRGTTREMYSLYTSSSSINSKSSGQRNLKCDGGSDKAANTQESILTTTKLVIKPTDVREHGSFHMNNGKCKLGVHQ